VIVHVNGEPREVSDEATVAAIVESVGPERARRGVAVAVDAEVVPRGQWERRRVHDGARIEILTAVQGG
jgi:sulfur carrier protein